MLDDVQQEQLIRMRAGLEPGATALLIIDMNDEYTLEGYKDTTPANNYLKAAATIRFLSKNFREIAPDMPQIWMADKTILSDQMKAWLEANPENEQGEQSKRKPNLTRSEVLSHYGEFEQEPHDAVMFKTTYNAFLSGRNVDTDETLTEYLRRKNIVNVLICGGAITQCVRLTALGAFDAGFRPVCVNEGITGGTSSRSDAIEELIDTGKIVVSSVYDMLPHYGIDTEPLKNELQEISRNLPRKPSLFSRLRSVIGQSYPASSPGM